MTALPAVSAPAPAPRRLFIIEDDPLMAECIARALSSYDARIFPDAISATNALADGLPDLVLLDVLLNGPDGFTFLNEMISYSDTARIPVILVTSLQLAEQNLAHYGVRAILHKETMTPANIRDAVENTLAVRDTESSQNPGAPQNPASPKDLRHAR